MKWEKRRCHCKSGKSFKDCKCGKFDKYGVPIRKQGPSKKEIEDIISHFQKLPKEPFDENGILTGRRFVDTVFKGKRVRAVGNQIRLRPLNETFHQFLFEFLADQVGRDWIREEYIKEEGKRNILAQWFLELETEMNTVLSMTQERNFIPIKMTGRIKSLLSIANDFYSLKHCSAEVLPRLLNRLKNQDMFHGARYEIAVAGIVARSGLNIEWINAKEKHCEFIATDPVTGKKYAVEAKSHARAGVMGKKGDGFDIETAKIKVADHLREATGQTSSEYPLILFDDINLPQTKDYNLDKKWLNMIDESLEKIDYFNTYKKTHVGAIFITNFPWHFESDVEDKQNEVVVYFHTNGTFSVDGRILGLLKLASEQYGHVPAKLEEREGLQ